MSLRAWPVVRFPAPCLFYFRRSVFRRDPAVDGARGWHVGGLASSRDGGRSVALARGGGPRSARGGPCGGPRAHGRARCSVFLLAERNASSSERRERKKKKRPNFRKFTLSSLPLKFSFNSSRTRLPVVRFAARKILACVSCHWGLLHERSVALAAAARRAGGGSRGVYIAW